MSYQICVSGAARGDSVQEGKEIAIAAGVAIAQAGHVLMSGATIGLPNYAAQGAKAMGGQSVGLSPAATKVEHIKKYHLPTESYDAIIYTGLHYVGRDTLLVASSDAVVSIGGRFGTLHEFTIAIEMHKPIGILLGAGGISTEIQAVMAAAGATENVDVIFDTSAEQLVKKLVRELNQRYGPDRKLYDD